ncbi:MAG: hypothetical protein AAB262_02170 [Elusimicrobiota bacterium]
MRRLSLPLALAASLSACVSVEPLAAPRQAIAPNQRLVVLVYQAPGPWIIKEADSKAEAAAKVLPMGFLVQTVQDDKTLELSKDLQQYLPRPRYDHELEAALLTTLKALHSGSVQTAAEAGLSPSQLREWNSAKDQLAWRRRYYAPEYGASAPRDYSKVLSLDDAVVLEVNLSFGTEATDEGQIQPAVSAALRLYRADTTRLLWTASEILTLKSSSMTLSEFKAQPRELTQILEQLAPRLGEAVARSTAKALGLTPPAGSSAISSGTAVSTGTTPGVLPYGLTQSDLARYDQSSSSAAGVSPAISTAAPVIDVTPDTPRP